MIWEHDVGDMQGKSIFSMVTGGGQGRYKGEKLQKILAWEKQYNKRFADAQAGELPWAASRDGLARMAKRLDLLSSTSLQPQVLHPCTS